MPDSITHAPHGFVRASNLYHVDQAERITHPDKQATDFELALELDLTEEASNAD